MCVRERERERERRKRENELVSVCIRKGGKGGGHIWMKLQVTATLIFCFRPCVHVYLVVVFFLFFFPLHSVCVYT